MHSFQGELHRRIAGKSVVAASDDRKRDEGRQHRSEECCQRACEPRHAVAEDDAGVDGDDARHGLRDGDHVESLLVVDPAVFVDVLRLQQRDDDEAAADRDGADDEGGRKELPVKMLGIARRCRNFCLLHWDCSFLRIGRFLANAVRNDRKACILACEFYTKRAAVSDSSRFSHGAGNGSRTHL